MVRVQNLVAVLCTFSGLWSQISTVHANTYAAALEGPATWNIETQGPITIKYRLNEPATEVTIEIFRDSAPNTVIKSLPGTTSYGLNSVTWDGTTTGQSKAPTADDYRFRVVASDSNGHNEWTNITPKSGSYEIGSAQFASPNGLAILTDQSNPGFGRILVCSGETSRSYNPGATAAGDGLFMLNNDMTFVGNSASNAFIPVPGSSASSSFSPWKINVNPDNNNEVVVSDYANGFENVSIVFIDTKTVYCVLDKTTTGPGTGTDQNHGNAISAWLMGTGDARTLLAIDQDFDGGEPKPLPANGISGYDFLRWNIGNTLTNYTGQPVELLNGSAFLPHTAVTNSGGRDLDVGTSGDLYCAHRVTGTAGDRVAAARFALDANGGIGQLVWIQQNYDLSIDPFIYPLIWQQTTAIATDEVRGRLAIGREGSDDDGGLVAILNTGDGTVLALFDSGDDNLRDLAWDAAGNLYTSNYLDEHVRMWSPPDGPNSFTTTCYASMNLTIPLGNDPPPAITTAVSRKIHGTAGTFDIDLLNPLSGNTCPVEDRKSGPTEVIVNFDQAIQRKGEADDVVLATTGAQPGTITGLVINGSELIITMNSTSDAARLKIAFPGIIGTGSAPSVATDTLCLGILYGDVKGDGRNNVVDMVAAKNNLNKAPTAATFPSDVTADGLINVLDLLAIKNALNRSIPSQCP